MEAGGTDGLSATTVSLCRHLGANGAEVELLTSDDHPIERSPGFEHTSVTTATRFRPGGWVPGMLESLKLRAGTADVVHVHGLWRLPGLQALRVAQIRRIPSVVSVHGMLAPEALRVSRWGKCITWPVLQRRALETASLIHATSEREHDDIRAVGIGAPVAIVPFGVEPWPTQVSAPTRRRTVLFFGRLHPIKGLDLLLDAWQRARRGGHEGWVLRIVGPEGVPGYRRELERIVQVRGVADVEFVSQQVGEAKWMELGAASLTVLPSRSENFGMAVAESLVSGTPVITTDRTPWSEISTVGAGWYVNCDARSIELALKEAMRLAESERRAMGERGRAWVLERFSWAAVAVRISKAYEWIASAAPRPDFVRV